jgi:hypothetical protein
MAGRFTPGTPKPLGSGRKRGQSNKITEEVRRLAKSFGPETVKELGRLATEAHDERARVEAAKVILDRAYGKASPLPLNDDGSSSPIKIVITGDDAKL